MKVKNIYSLIVIIIMAATSIVAYGQNEKNRVALKGSAVMVSDNATDWGLEVGGKLVVAKNYTHFKTSNGKFFAVKAKDGKMGICNDKGTFIFPCKHFKTNVSASIITIIETSGAKSKFYNTSNPTAEVVAKQMTASDLSNEIAKKAPAGTYVDMNNAKHVRAVKQAAKVSAEAPFGAFEFRTTANGKQELLVDGKVIFTALSFNLISDAAYYNRTTCWNFVVSDYVGSKEQYGLYGISIYKDKTTGKKSIEEGLDIPYEYSFISQYEAKVVKCTTWSGAPKYFTWMGKPFDITVKGGGL